MRSCRGSRTWFASTMARPRCRTAPAAPEFSHPRSPRAGRRAASSAVRPAARSMHGASWLTRPMTMPFRMCRSTRPGTSTRACGCASARSRRAFACCAAGFRRFPTARPAPRSRKSRAAARGEVDAGSCNGCELEIHALNNPVYDVERFGIRFVASPRHADVLMVTGPVTRNMKVALERTYAATPDPKWVVAVGDCGCGCGVFEGSYAVIGAIEKVIPVDLHIRGCPPSPTALLEGLIALIDKACANRRP